VGQMGDKFAPDRWFGKLSRSSSSGTMPGGIEDQPDEWPDDRVFPVTRQATLRTPGTIACAIESRYVLTGTAQLLKGDNALLDG